MYIQHKKNLIYLYLIFLATINTCHSGINDEFQYIALNHCYGGFQLSKENIKYLRNKYPEEEFPNYTYGYNCNKIRLNQEFCAEIKSNPGKFRSEGTKLIVKKIPKLALCFPSCWRIKEYDGYESLVIDDEKLKLMSSQKKYSHITHINRIVRNIIHSDAYTDKEKLDYFKDIYIQDKSDSDSDLDLDLDSDSKSRLPSKKLRARRALLLLSKKRTVKRSYTEKIIDNFPSIRDLGNEFKETQESFYNNALKEMEKNTAAP